MSEQSIFTAMGMSGSGKTCYVLGLFDAMASGIRGFTLDPQDEAKKLLDWTERLHKAKGKEKFPEGTSNSEFTRYNFKLKHNFKQILSFEWADYAGGLLKSSKFVKREGKPSDEAILKARLIDRSIRPMFSKEMRREVQVIINVLASDKENPHDVLGLTAACAALAISDIPFDCNIGGIRLSQVDGKFVCNPTYAECERQDFELVLGGNANKVIMIECASNRVADDVIIKGFEESYKYLGQVANAIVELQKEFGKPKAVLPEFPNYDELIERVKDTALKGIEEFSKILEYDNSVRARFDEIIINPVLALFTEEELEKTSYYLKTWITEANSSAQEEQDFAFKYLFMPSYRQVTSGRTLFSYITSDALFKVTKEQNLNIDYRWICNNSIMPIEDSFTMMGIYKNCKNQVGASEFISWFFQSENQQDILERKNQLKLETELFGISGGFSAVRDVTEHILPIYYTQLLSNLPPAQMISVSQKLPARWDSYKSLVVEPYLRDSIIEPTVQPVSEYEKEWHKKVFD